MSKGLLQWLVPTGSMLIIYSISLYTSINIIIGVILIVLGYGIPYFLITKYYEEKTKEIGNK